MKAKKTFYIGLFVTILSLIQLIYSGEYLRIIGILIGIFFMIFGGKIGWTSNKNFTIAIGHFAITIGCFTIAYSVYQIPFLSKAPTFLQVLDLPLFWGLFTLWGGNCMITHGYCNCAIKLHEKYNNITKKA